MKRARHLGRRSLSTSISGGMRLSHYLEAGPRVGKVCAHSIAAVINPRQNKWRNNFGFMVRRLRLDFCVSTLRQVSRRFHIAYINAFGTSVGVKIAYSISRFIAWMVRRAQFGPRWQVQGGPHVSASELVDTSIMAIKVTQAS